MKSLRPAGNTIIRLGIAVAVMVWLFRKMGVENLGQTLRQCADQWPWLAAALILSLVPLLLCMARWKLILDAQDMRLPWSRINNIFFIGLFFNSFMIGPTGGDLIKAYLTAKETNHKKTEAVTSIFIDRIIGVLSLAAIVVFMILIRWDFLMSHNETRKVVLPVLGVCAALLGGGILAFSVHLFETFPFLKRLTTHRLIGKIAAVVEKVYNAFYVCRTHPKLLAQICLYSLILQILFVVVSAFVGKALGLTVSFVDYMTFGPLIGLVSAIPVTPGGLGIREGTSVHLWSVLAVAADKAFLLAFLPFVFLIILGLPGGILFLFHRSSNKEALTEEQPS
jgi:uncharacterized protein (TIRG00374 family)